jgi:hypothetical protein
MGAFQNVPTFYLDAARCAHPYMTAKRKGGNFSLT